MINKRYERQETKRPDGPHGWIQWKGTDVCMDIVCSCGASGHIDQDFAYHYKCMSCNKFFDIAGYVHLIEVPEDEMTEYDIKGLGVAVSVKDSLTKSKVKE
jgi:hypothetical protein